LHSPGGTNVHPHLTRASLNPPDCTSKSHLDRFSHFCTAHGRKSLYFTIGRPSPPLKTASSHRGSGHPSNTRFLQSTRVHNPNGISIGSAVFAGLMIVTDQQTTLLPSITIAASMYGVLRCGLKSKCAAAAENHRAGPDLQFTR